MHFLLYLKNALQSCEFMFAVKTKKGGVETSHIFGNKNAANKKKWIRLLQLNIDAIKDKKAAPPVVTPRGASNSMLLRISITRFAF